MAYEVVVVVVAWQWECLRLYHLEKATITYIAQRKPYPTLTPSTPCFPFLPSCFSLSCDKDTTINIINPTIDPITAPAIAPALELAHMPLELVTSFPLLKEPSNCVPDT